MKLPVENGFLICWIETKTTETKTMEQTQLIDEIKVLLKSEINTFKSEINDGMKAIKSEISEIKNEVLGLKRKMANDEDDLDNKLRKSQNLI
jgi:hypothetical protein